MIPRLRRRSELGLILLSAVIIGGAYTLASLGRTASIPANIGPFLGIVLGLVLVAHLAVRRLAPAADGILLPVAGLLNGLGYVVIARLDRTLAGLQAAWTGVGIVAFILTLLVVRRTRDLQSRRYTLAFLGVGLLLLPLLPHIGRPVQGARVWVFLGPMSFQPGEVAKICLVIFLAAYLVEKRELLAMATWPKFKPVLPDLKHLGPILVAVGMALLVLVFENDFGQSLLLVTLFIVMIWVATERSSYLVVGFGLFGAGAYAAWKQVAHVQARFTIWLDPWKSYSGNGYQIVQGAFAMAWGGVAGTGLGLGSPHLVPESQNDFIFAVVGEELGVLGSTVVLVAFLMIIGAGLRIAIQAEGGFDKLLATGVTALIGFQSFIIIAGVTRVLPLTGVALQFVSYGGSSLVSSYILLALLMRVSDESTRKRLANAVPR